MTFIRKCNNMGMFTDETNTVPKVTEAAAKSFCDLLTATEWGFEPQDRMNAAIELVAFIRNAALTGREMHVLYGCLEYAKQNEQ